MTRNFALLTDKPWHDELFLHLDSRKGENWIRISSKVELSIENLQENKISKIFIPHWSHIIPDSIWQQFECIVFHITDLPYGRGGSPLQNLIARGHRDTKISAIKVEKKIDSGMVYLKAPLSLLGTAQEIFIRSSEIIERMIEKIISSNIVPIEQEGEVVNFKRRKLVDSNISELSDTIKAFDYIRMLDCEGYPSAFLETENLRFEFTRASIKSDKSIIADVRITKK